MICSTNIVSVLGLFAVIPGLALASVWVPLSNQAEVEGRMLVAMIESRRADIDQLGAGVIFSRDDDSILVVTANHNVRRGSQTADSITVYLNGDLDRPYDATVEPHFNQELDLAVLRIAVDTNAFPVAAQLPFDRIRNPRELKKGDYVFSMGYPLGRPWAVSVEPDRFAGISKDKVFFESRFIAPGHSGGALWDQNLKLVGLILSDQAPHGEALSISRVISALGKWGYGVDLGSPKHLPVFSDVSVAWKHACALTNTGLAYCLGENTSGTLGSGTEGHSKEPLRVTGQHKFVQVGVGRDFACGVDDEHHLWCWGANHMGAIGDGSPGDPRGKKDPVAVLHGEKFGLVSVGDLGACALSLSGEAWCWNAIPENHKTPQPAMQGKKFSWIDVGNESFVCGVTIQGKLSCWSLINFGEEIAIPAWPDLRQIFVGNPRTPPGKVAACGKSKDDVVYCASRLESKPQMLDMRLKEIRVGSDHACGLTEAREAWCWGENESGQLGNGDTASRDFPVKVDGEQEFLDLSCGWESTCGATADGKIWCWGKVGSIKSLRPSLMSRQ